MHAWTFFKLETRLTVRAVITINTEKFRISIQKKFIVEKQIKRKVVTYS